MSSTTTHNDGQFVKGTSLYEIPGVFAKEVIV